MFRSGFEVQVYNYLCKKGYTNFLVNLYPSWLRSPQTGRKLQLDLYDPERKIAVEVQGPTHFQDYTQIMRDSYKLQSCENNAVKLYYVRYWNKAKDLADLESRLGPTDQNKEEKSKAIRSKKTDKKQFHLKIPKRKIKKKKVTEGYRRAQNKPKAKRKKETRERKGKENMEIKDFYNNI